MPRVVSIATAVAVAAVACGGAGDGAVPGATVAMDFSGDSSFYSAPFPSAHRRRPDGGVDLGGFPNPQDVGLVAQVLALAEDDANGFGLTSGAFFHLDEEPDVTRIPTSPSASLSPEAPLFWLDVDRRSPRLGQRVPFYATWTEDPGPFGAPGLLALVPYQGRPLAPRTLYAVGVTRVLGAADGAPLGVSAEMAALAHGRRPAGLAPQAFARYREAIESLRDLGIPPGTLAGLAVFETGDPARGMRALADAAERMSLPTLEAAWRVTDVFDDLCVLESEIEMPVFQQGQPPFFAGGGRIAFDEAGEPVGTGTERSRIVVTIPRRRPRSQAGFPYVLFVRSGGGGDRPLVDRGRRTGPGTAPEEPGEGPARYFARAGYAAITYDGPHGGLRNVSGIDEQLTTFNFVNPVALRDNIRENAVEAVIVTRFASTLSFDAGLCPDAGDGPIRLDADDVAIMGHSIGATVAPLALATSGRYGAAVLSGAGGSYLENVLFKRSPVPVKPIAEALVRYVGDGRSLTREDPFLNVLQWAAEPADPPIYGPEIVDAPRTGAPRHVLMFQGIEDTYITPSIANATTASIRLDLAGPALESSVLDAVALAGRGTVDLPASGNRTDLSEVSARTAVVVQHREDPFEDGHEIVFQLEAPKHQYRCFLATLGAGDVPTVPQVDGPCPVVP